VRRRGSTSVLALRAAGARLPKRWPKASAVRLQRGAAQLAGARARSTPNDHTGLGDDSAAWQPFDDFAGEQQKI